MEKESLAKLDYQSQYDDFDNYLIKSSQEYPFPQTEFQCNNFVSGSHPTLYRQMRQTFLEIDTRKHSGDKINISIRKTELQIEKLEKEYEQSSDEYRKREIEIELDDLDLDMKVWNKKLLQCHTEMRYFLDWVKKHCPNEADTIKYLELDDEEEHKYWIARMAKQTSIDIITTGRLGSGNLDSIMQMEEEDQVKTLQLALSYAGAVNAGVEQLKLESEKSIRFLRDEIPNNKFLEENSNVTSETKSIQSSNQSET